MRGAERLLGQDRYVLRDCVSENRPKEPYVKVSPVAEPQHCLRSDLIGYARNWPEACEGVPNVAVESNTGRAGDHGFEGCWIDPRAVTHVRHRLREDNVPARTERHSQLSRGVPGVLNIGIEAVLAFCGVGRIAHVPLKEVHSSQHKVSQPQSSTVWALCQVGVKAEFTGAMGITWYTKVPGMSPIRTELESMVAVDDRPVVDKLCLHLLFGQRTVAAVDTESIAELKPSGLVYEESRHAGSNRVGIQTGYPRISSRTRPESIRADADRISEEAKSEIGKRGR